MEPRLGALRYRCLDENEATLQAPPLVRSALISTLDRRDTQGLIARHRELAAQELPPRPDNRLRHVACLQAASDVLGEDYAVRLSDEEIRDGVAQVRGEDYLWPTFLDLGLALSLRHGRLEAAHGLAMQRLKAPLGPDLHTTVQLLHARSSTKADALAMSELGHLGALAALSMGGTAQAATPLALVAACGAAWSPALLLERARAWDGCVGKVERDDLQWSIDPATKGVRATLTVRTAGDLCDCAGSVLEEFVYSWPLHLDRLVNRQVPLTEIRGATTRKAVLAAVKSGGVEAVLDLRGTTLAPHQLAALVERQDAGLSWIRANHAALSEQPSGIRLLGA